MKFLLTITLALVIHTSLFANKIDSLKTDAEVEKFIHKQNKKYKSYRVVPLEKLYFDASQKKIADSLHVKNWQIVDFDNNGFSDLMVYGLLQGDEHLLVITDNGKKISYHSFNHGFLRKRYYPTIENIKGINSLVLQEIDDHWDEGPSDTKIHTLVYKFNTFIELNYKPITHKISKIEYATTECFGTCPVFKIEIDANRNLIYNALKYNDISGVFHSEINMEDYYSLIQLINYLDFPNLKDQYKVNWTDDQGCTLTITYDNGKIKTINDYGKIGTFGLIQVYDKMFDLRKKQDWH